MSTRNNTKTYWLLGVGLMVIIGSAIFSAQSRTEATASGRLQAAEAPAAAAQKTTGKKSTDRYLKFTKIGQLIRPTGYRKWIYVGTPLTPNDMNKGKAPFPEFHSVYIDPASFAVYEKTGKFPDGTILIKELVSVGDKEATSGKGYFMSKFIGLEVSIKDKSRFKKDPGYWGYFSFGHKYPIKKMSKAQPAMNCNSCHEGNADDDFVFTQYYPVLRAAKKSSGSK